MRKKLSFNELVQSICKSPSMYTLRGSYNEVVSFIEGYAAATRSPISGNSRKIFNRFVCLKFSFPTNYNWAYVLQASATDDAAAIISLENTFMEFADKRQSMSEHELFEYAIKTGQYQEGVPEKIYREFSDALLLGEEEVLSKYIQPHPDAAILWQGAYPADVAKMLAEISASQVIRRVYESEDGHEVKIITADFPFPIGMILVDGAWKIDASDIIGIRQYAAQARRLT